MDNTTKQHYYLAAGHVMFHPVIKDQAAEAVEVGSTHLNAVLVVPAVEAKDPVVTSKDLGRAQQALQMQLHQRTQGQEINVVDVTFTAIIYLGLMTPAEFLGTPAAAEQPSAPTVQ